MHNILRPRLVIELNDPELNALVKMIAATNRTSMRAVVLRALARTYPELAPHIERVERVKGL